MERVEIPANPSAQRHDLDWLRVLAVLLLVPFHCALIFAPDPRFFGKRKSGLVSPSFQCFANMSEEGIIA